jgi:hypothetical protein
MLSLLGLGTNGDPYAQNGRHLRWFFGPMLGFPRSGFLLRRRVSPLGWHDPVLAGSGLIRTQLTSQGALGTSPQRFPSGITVAKRNGFTYVTTTVPGLPPLLKIEGAFPVTFDFGHLGLSEQPPEGPDAVSPMAYACLFFARRRLSGSLSVSVWSKGGSARRRLGGFFKGPSGGAVNDWVMEQLVVHGSMVEQIELTGKDVGLQRIEWVNTRDYVTLQDWANVDRFYIPLTNAAPIYPNWTGLTGLQVAQNRLEQAPPRAFAPWDVTTYPPPPADPAAMQKDLRLRYLGLSNAGFGSLDADMRQFLAYDLAEHEPQLKKELTQVLSSLPGESSPISGSELTYSPLGLIYAQAMDPQMARILGLMHTDFFDSSATAYDYSVDASWDPLFIAWLLFPDTLGPDATEIRKAGGVWTPPWGGSATSQQAFAIVTAITRAAAPAPLAVEDLRTTVEWWPKGTTHTRAEVSWLADPDSYFDAPAKVRVYYAVRRSGPGGDVPLHDQDPDTRKYIPRWMSAEVMADGRSRLWDLSMPSYGTYTYRVSGLDLWGRFCPPASVNAVISDLMGPPAPGGVRAELLGPASAAPAWIAMRVSFDWLAAQQLQATDLARFDVHVTQGRVTPPQGQDPATWGKLEHVPGATTAPLRVSWPALIPTPPGGLAATVTSVDIPVEQGGGKRITVEVGPVSRVFDDAGVAEMSATVTAVDTADHVSPFAPFDVAVRPDEYVPPPPPQPPGLLYASRMDWLARSFFRLPLAIPSGHFAHVLRTPSNVLLQTAGVNLDDYEAMSEEDRLALLRTLALDHRKVFTVDHPFPYQSTDTGHVSVLNGNDRGWTVYTVLPANKVFKTSTWPTDPLAFAIVAVPRIPGLRVPLVDEVAGGDRRITIRIQPDLTGQAAKFRVYRTRDEAMTDDLRLMRPVVDLPAVSTTEPITWIDEDVYPDIPYYYRFVALDEDGVQSEPTHARSAVAWSSLPPDPPEIANVKIPAGGGGVRRVRIVLARRDYPLTVFRVRRGAPGSTYITGSDPDTGTLDVGALSPVLVDGRWRIDVDDVVPDATAVWAYRARVTDPRGRQAHSALRREGA